MFAFRKNDKGVSPVIGVILMVAITVILAAIIAAFVLGQSNVTSTPQASIVIDSVNTNVATGGYWINLSHQGGSSFYLKDVRLVITDKTSLQQLVIDPVTTTTTIPLNVSDKLSIRVNTPLVAKNYGAGLTLGTTSGSLVSWSVGDELSIQVIYKPSSNFIADLSTFA